MSASPRKVPTAHPHRKPGLAYLSVLDGLEVPVIDFTNPAFAMDPKDEEMAAALASTAAYMEKAEGMPRPLRHILMASVLRGSRLAEIIGRARGGYLSGLGCYLAKLGADNLWPGSSRGDRGVASSFPCYSARVRMFDVSSLAAGELLNIARNSPGAAVRLVALAGGAGTELLNGILLARAAEPDSLKDHPLTVELLDLDSEGPAFGRRAFGALAEAGFPLHGLDIQVMGSAYDWNDRESLARVLESWESPTGTAARALFVSEGGLFDYASDEAVVGDLRLIGERSAPGTAVIGTMSEIEGDAGRVNRGSGAKLRLRGWAEFEALLAEAGWRLEAKRIRPLSTSFLARRSETA